MALFEYDNIVILVFLLTYSNTVSQEDRNVFLVTDTISNGDQDQVIKRPGLNEFLGPLYIDLTLTS